LQGDGGIHGKLQVGRGDVVGASFKTHHDFLNRMVNSCGMHNLGKPPGLAEYRRARSL
jgi:hypothetical protein